MSTKLKAPSVLAFARSIDISDAFFWQINSKDAEQNRSIVTVQEKSVRGTISNRLKKPTAGNSTKQDADIEKANLQRVDASSLDEDKDILLVHFTCKILPFTAEPCVCNDQAYQEKLQTVMSKYIEEQGFKELARRYAINIANARWLWRNRVGAESILVTVTLNEKESLTFDACAFELRHFNYKNKELDQLAQWIESGFKGEQFVLLSVEARAKIGYGQEVYPSQELILDDDSKSKKSKVLYRVGDVSAVDGGANRRRRVLYRVGDGSDNHAGMHSQKISNAIRTIDDWYPEAEFPIAVEPYGAVTTLGKAFRHPKDKKDFYNLFDNWILKDQVPEVNDQHYVAAVLIRGGVF